MIDETETTPSPTDAPTSEPTHTYTRSKPDLPESPAQLARRIPGWGVDRDIADRPSGHRLLDSDHPTGAHWQFPERMLSDGARERSIEHAFLTPVFGTAQPLHGVSGAIRRIAYARYSEARLSHWLLLLAGDRIEATGAHLRSLVSLRPDNPVTETGIRTELTHHGLRSRVRARRADLPIQALDPLLVAAPWIAAGWLLRRRRRRSRRTAS